MNFDYFIYLGIGVGLIGTAIFICLSVIDNYQESLLEEELCENNNLRYYSNNDIEFCVGYKDGELVKWEIIRFGERYKLYKGANKK